MVENFGEINFNKIHFEVSFGEVYHIFSTDNLYSGQRNYLGKGVITKIFRKKREPDNFLLIRQDKGVVCHSFLEYVAQDASLVIKNPSEFPLTEPQRSLADKILQRRRL